MKTENQKPKTDFFMKLWLSKNGDVSIRDQLTRQIILAIVSGDLRAGDRLPSVRELALHHKIHPNTASAAYRWLEENGWATARVGSGVYVREISQAKIDETAKTIEGELDALILAFLNEARQRGFEKAQIKSRLDLRLKNKPPRKICIVENDENLARIFAHELAEKFSLPVSIANSNQNDFAKNTLVVSLSDTHKTDAASVFVKLKLNSVQEAMRGQTKPEKTDLIGVASHWEMFLRWSQTMLVAVGIEEENLVVRDANFEGWKNGLNSCRFVIADSLTAAKLTGVKELKIFRLISESSLQELRALLS